MKLSMIAEFKLFRNENGAFMPVSFDDVENVSVGGYNFIVGDREIPFDWDAFSVEKHHADPYIFCIETDYDLSNYCDEAYAEMGLERGDITAEFLASASSIDDFFVYFEDDACPPSEESFVGSVDDNSNPESPHRLELLDVKFIDVETGKEYSVHTDVLTAFNRGEKERAMSSEERDNPEGNVQDGKITVLIIEPGKRPYEKEIDPGLGSLQREVGGDIEVVYPFEEPVAVICNEEGKLDGLPLNRVLCDEDGEPYDIIAGTFMVAGLDGGRFGSLEPEHMEKFKEHFRVPERFYKRGGQIVVVANDLDDRIRDYAAQTRKGGDDGRERYRGSEEREA